MKTRSRLAAPPVRHAMAADLSQLARTLASAFAKDPVMCWLFDDVNERSSQLSHWMQFCLKMGLTRGHVYLSPMADAAAIWSPPDVTLFDELWGPRLAELMKQLIGKALAEERMVAMAASFGQGNVDEPHFYLFMLGTEPASQGRGLGSTLLEPMLERCDEQALAVHLESSNPRNVPFYQRHGFELTAEIELGGDGPLVQPMRRAPRGAGY